MRFVSAVGRLGVGHWHEMRGCPTVTRVRAYCGWGECGTLWRVSQYLHLIGMCFEIIAYICTQKGIINEPNQ